LSKSCQNQVIYVSDSQSNTVLVTRYNNGTATTFFYHYNDVVAIITGAIWSRLRLWKKKAEKKP